MSDEEEEIKKVDMPEEYPPEDGNYLRGNDYSPVVVVVILNQPYEEVPERVDEIVRASVEAGAAIAGTLQTENIGMEKVIANVIANPNIRHAVLCGIESRGHLTGEAFRAFMENGTNDRKRIIGTDSPDPFLYNTSLEAIERFRNQVNLVDLMGETDIELIKEAVNACFQEKPTKFMNYELHDPGAYPEPPICQSVNWKIGEPWKVEEPEENEEQLVFNVDEKAYEKLKELAKKRNLTTPEIAAKNIIQDYLAGGKNSSENKIPTSEFSSKKGIEVIFKNPTVKIEEIHKEE